eukprot:715854_1
MTPNCETEHETAPMWVSIVYGVFSFIAFIFTIIVSVKLLKHSPTKHMDSNMITTKPSSVVTNADEHESIEMKDNAEDETQTKPRAFDAKAASNDWNEASFCQKIKLCARDVWGRKSIYLPLVSHLADSTTDIASIVEFGIIGSTYSEKECGVNVWWLFALSIGCMLFYRIISAYKMYQITDGSWKRAILQLLDLELYHVLYFSHKWRLNGTSSPQRMIGVLEAVFEAAPQSVIQLTYLLFMVE